jgi:hypothetical protein
MTGDPSMMDLTRWPRSLTAEGRARWVIPLESILARFGIPTTTPVEVELLYLRSPSPVLQITERAPDPPKAPAPRLFPGRHIPTPSPRTRLTRMLTALEVGIHDRPVTTVDLRHLLEILIDAER